MKKPTYTVTVNNKQAHRIELDHAGAFAGKIDGKTFSLDSNTSEPGHFHVLRNAVSYAVEVLHTDAVTKTVTLKVNGNTYEAVLKDKYDELLHALGMDGLASRKVNELKAPMPGLVLDVVVAEGAAVKKGDALIILEAMKMENILKSPTDGQIKKISVKKGVAVEKNQLLIEFV